MNCTDCTDEPVDEVFGGYRRREWMTQFFYEGSDRKLREVTHVGRRRG